MQTVKENYDAALLLYHDSKYKDAANRAYYAIFNSLRAVLALDAIDFKKHSGVISYYRQNYIKTGEFDHEYSDVIGHAFLTRNQSDYEDFFVISKEEAMTQCENALKLFMIISTYIESKEIEQE